MSNRPHRRHRHRTGPVAFATPAELAEETGLSEREILEHTSALVDKGWLAPTDDGGYRLTIPNSDGGR